MWTCRFCNNEFDFEKTTEKGNHARHCEKNPYKKRYGKNLETAADKRFGAKQSFIVSCEVCDKPFEVIERSMLHPNKKHYFCCRKCANSIGGKAKSKKHHHDDVAHYITVAFRHHEKKCVVCGEDKIVAVHHYDCNHNNNEPNNLVPLCPTHHSYMHSKYKYLIENQVKNYVNKRGVLRAS